jgi:hypothetical protein
MMPLVHHQSASAQRLVNDAVRVPIVALERSARSIVKVEAVYVGIIGPRPEDRVVRLIGYLEEVLEGCITEGAVEQEK